MRAAGLRGFCVGLWVVMYTTAPRSRPWTRGDAHNRIKAVSRLLRAHGVQMFWIEWDEERASREEANVNLSFNLSLDHLFIKHSRKLLIMRSNVGAESEVTLDGNSL